MLGASHRAFSAWPCPAGLHCTSASIISAWPCGAGWHCTLSARPCSAGMIGASDRALSSGPCLAGWPGTSAGIHSACHVQALSAYLGVRVTMSSSPSHAPLCLLRWSPPAPRPLATQPPRAAIVKRWPPRDVAARPTARGRNRPPVCVTTDPRPSKPLGALHCVLGSHGSVAALVAALLVAEGVVLPVAEGDS